MGRRVRPDREAIPADRVSNSNFANRIGNPIKDLRTAIAGLGYDLACSTAVSIAVEQILQSKSVGACRDQFSALR
ncbi:MAG: hypothetical protein P8178_07635 [Candidatus Thiodiazotropha sp.]